MRDTKKGKSFSFFAEFFISYKKVKEEGTFLWKINTTPDNKV